MLNKSLKKYVAIIGAGPAGLYCAYLLAKKGFSVSVFEEHNKIGLPVKCTGLVTNSIKKIINIPENVIKNQIEFANIISPNDHSIIIKLKDQNLVLDRAKFDQFLSKKALGFGAKIHLKHKFCRLTNGDHKIIIVKDKNKNIEYKVDYLIGADGPQSKISRLINNKGISKQSFVGIQARIRIDVKNKNTLEFYPIKKGFCWFVPESDKVVRVGIACYNNQKKVFNGFLKRIEKRHNLKISKHNDNNAIQNKTKNKTKFKNKNQTITQIIDYQAGLIPIYNPKIKTFNRIYNKNKIDSINLYLVGDSATQVKATTAGGIVQSLLSAEALVGSIVGCGGKYKSYPMLWKKSIGKDLMTHLLIRRILDKFNNKDYDYLFKLTNQDKIKNILSKYDRDFVLNLGLSILVNEPRFLLFLRRLF